MRQITAQEKYRAVKEGVLTEGEFVRQMRLAFPQFLSPMSTYPDTVQILKNYDLINEGKEAKEAEELSKYSDDSLRRAIDIELEAMGLMSQETISGEDHAKAKLKAINNLKKDPLHYYNLIAGESSKVDKNDRPKETKRGKLEKDTFNDMKKATLKERKENLVEGTRALVGYLSGDRLTTTYNHYDGYPSHLGKALEMHYNDDDKAKEIAMVGYITGIDGDTGEVQSTHKEKPGKLVLPDDKEQRAREIGEEIDSYGAEYGYVWDDNTNQWITIKNTGIRSMIDQILEKLDMVNVYSGDTMEKIEVDEAHATKKAVLENAVHDIKQVYPELTRDIFKEYINTHYTDLLNDPSINVAEDFMEWAYVNGYMDTRPDDLDEAEPLDTTAAYKNDDDTQDMIDKMRKDGKDSDDFVDEKKVSDFAPSPNSNVPDANAEEYDVATAFKKAGVDMSKPVMVIHSYGSAAFGGNDKDEMSAEAAIKKLEAERQDRSKQYTDDGEEVPEDHHGYEFENYSVLEEDMPEGHEYKLGYFQLGDADFAITQEKSGVSEKKVNEEDSLEAFSDTIQVVGYPKTVEDALKVIERYERDRDPVSREEAKDLVAGMRATDDDAFDRNITNLIVKAFNIKLKGISEKKGKDHDGDGDVDGDDYMHAKDKAIKKAMGKDEAVRENLKAIITKVLEEKQINEAATNVLSAFGDDYAGFDGMKSAINALENIVTDIEQYYDKTRAKIQKVYDTLGEIRNEEGLKVGGFLAPAVEQAFNRDLRPVIKQGFTKALDMPQVKKLASPGMAQETEAPKQTVFGLNENKKK